MPQPDYVSSRFVTGFDQACQAYRRGHVAHWIQVGLARRKDTYRPAEILSADGHWLTIATEGGVRRLWHHDTATIALALRRVSADVPGLTVEYSQRFGLLLVSSLNLEENAERGPARTGIPLCVSDGPSECGSSPT